MPSAVTAVTPVAPFLRGGEKAISKSKTKPLVAGGLPPLGPSGPGTDTHSGRAGQGHSTRPEVLTAHQDKRPAPVPPRERPWAWRCRLPQVGASVRGHARPTPPRRPCSSWPARGGWELRPFPTASRPGSRNCHQVLRTPEGLLTARPRPRLQELQGRQLAAQGRDRHGLRRGHMVPLPTLVPT